MKRRRAIVLAVVAVALVACGQRREPDWEAFSAARPAYAEDPSEFLRRGHAYLAEHPGGPRRTEISNALDDGPGLVLRHRFWRRVAQAPTRADVDVLAYLNELIAQEEAADAPWSERLRAWTSTSGIGLGMDAATWKDAQARGIAYRAGYLPTADASARAILEIERSSKGVDHAEYSGTGPFSRVARMSHTIRLTLRREDEEPWTDEVTAVDPPLPEVMTFGQYGGAIDYHTAEAEAWEAAGTRLREAHGTSWAPLRQPPASDLSWSQSLTDAYARALTDAGERARANARDLGNGLRDAPNHPLAAEVRAAIEAAGRTHVLDEAR